MFLFQLLLSLTVKMQVMGLRSQGFCEATLYVKKYLKKVNYKCQCVILAGVIHPAYLNNIHYHNSFVFCAFILTAVCKVIES